MRINKYIAHTGLCSRRKADLLVDDNKVYINGVLANKSSIVSDKDRVVVDGEECRLEKFVYLAFNKPAGLLTASSDRFSDTIMEAIDIKERVFPLGRLDKDTEGLLILTNDGSIFNKMMHPKAEVEKIYKVVLEQEITDRDISKLEKGVYIPVLEHKTIPCQIRREKNCLYVSLYEGKKRQIRRMFESVGNRVKYLQRLSVGKIKLGDLKVGRYRHLNQVEVAYLQSL